MTAPSTPVNMGVESVSYLPTIAETRADYPRAKVNIPVGASIPSRVGEVFNLHASDNALHAALKPSLRNPSVTVPAHYHRLFNDLVNATGSEAGRNPEEGRVLQSAHALMMTMQSEFDALNASRYALVKS